MQPGDVTKTFADVSRAHTELGYLPQTSIEQGIDRYVTWYRQQSQP
jgi:UDP-glucuronate 4-epimerase